MSSKQDLLIRLDTQFNGGGFKSAEASAKAMVREMDRVEAAERNMANLQMAAYREGERRRAAQLAGMQELGTAAGLLGVAIAAGLGIAGKAAMDWESDWAGVTKTVNGSDKELAQLEGQLRQLARTLPASHREIAAVAEAAGQLGVKRQDVARFTKTMIDLGVSTNLSADEAATGLAQLGNVMGVLPSEAGRAGAALVALGNDGASTEADILSMAQRIAGAGKTVGMTEANVLGFANALSSMGIEAEAGGSAISRVMVDIGQAVEQGGENLEVMARLAGQTGDQFKVSFEQDAASAVVSVIDGLGKLDASGQSTFSVLDKLGWSGIRVRDTLLRASNSGDLLRSSLELGSKAWAENTALVEEANKRYETSASRVKIARNELTDAAIDMGAVVLPALAGVADRVGALASAFRELPEPVKTGIVVLGSLAAAALLTGGAALTVVPKLHAMNAALAATGVRGAAAARGLGAAGGALMGPWGLALAGATIALGYWANKQYEAQQAQDELAMSLDQQTGAYTDNTRAIMAKRLQDEGLLDVADGLGVSLADLTDAAVGNTEAVQRIAAASKAAHEQYVAMTEAAKAGKDVDYEALVAAEAKAQAFDTLAKATGGLRDEMQPAIDQTRQQAEAMGQGEEAATSAATATEGFGDVLGGLSSDAKAAEDAIDKLIDSVRDYGSKTLDARAATRDYQASLDTATEAVKEATKAGIAKKKMLDLDTEAGRKNQAALDDIATSALKAATANFENGASVESVTRSIIGPGGARDSFVNMATKMGMGKVEANKLATQLGLTRGNVSSLSQAIKDTPTSHSTKMTVETKTALEQLNGFKAFLATIQGKTVGVHTRYTYTGTRPTGGKGTGGGSTFDADGSIHQFADGGFAPVGSQAPQVRAAGGGGMTWSEQGAGPWEAFISGHPGKRERSLAIWEDVGRRLGAMDGHGGGRGAVGFAPQPNVDRSITVTAHGLNADDVASRIQRAAREAEALNPDWG